MQETNYDKEKEPHMLNKVTIENQHTMVKGGAKTTEITTVLVSHAVEIQEQNNLNIASANIFTDHHEDPPGEESEITKNPISHMEIQPKHIGNTMISCMRKRIIQESIDRNPWMGWLEVTKFNLHTLLVKDFIVSLRKSLHCMV